MPSEPGLPSNYTPPKSVEEFCDRYDRGERYFRDAKFPKGFINRPVDGADLRGLRCGHTFVFGEADFSGCNLREATFDGTGWWDVTMSNCNLEGATFDYADISVSSTAKIVSYSMAPEAQARQVRTEKHVTAGSCAPGKPKALRGDSGSQDEPLLRAP